MQPENTFDIPNGMVYNTTNNNDEHEAVDIIKMDEHEPLNDVNCTHETLVANPNDTIGSAVYHGCANPKCGRGFYLQNKNIT